MANCTQKQIPQPKYGYTLELSEEEAGALIDICMNIGGNPDKTDRKYTRSICQALSHAGVVPNHSRRSGAITYLD